MGNYHVEVGYLAYEASPNTRLALILGLTLGLALPAFILVVILLGCLGLALLRRHRRAVRSRKTGLPTLVEMETRPRGRESNPYSEGSGGGTPAATTSETEPLKGKCDDDKDEIRDGETIKGLLVSLLSIK